MQSGAGRLVELKHAVPNPRRVMVGTDRSETAERAVQWAADFADRFGADLHVVQVIVPEHPADTEEGSAERIQAAAMADDLLQHARSIAGDRGRGRIVVDDDPAMAMVRAAEEDAIDVLIVGNAGMAGRKEFLLGNVPNRISHNARCIPSGLPVSRALSRILFTGHRGQRLFTISRQNSRGI